MNTNVNPTNIGTATVLALDMATQKTGYAIYQHNRIIAHGRWQIDQTKPYADLGARIYKTIERHKINTLVAEDFYISENPKYNSAAAALGKCQGILTFIAESKNIPMTFITPVEVKRRMWGYNVRTHSRMSREQQKNEMIKAVQSWGYKLMENRNGRPSDDEADAIGLLITYIRNSEKSLIYPKHPSVCYHYSKFGCTQSPA